MPPSNDISTVLCGIAAPVIRGRVRCISARLGLRPEDREDMEQELWLLLLLWWNDTTQRQPRDQPSLWLRHDVKHRIDRLIALLMRSGSFWRRMRPTLERSSSHWLAEGFVRDPPGDAQRYHELGLDVAAVLSRLPHDCRTWCESVLHSNCGSVTSSPPIPSQLSSEQLAALRRTFRAHGLHEYL